jgi:hypothetical protein
MSEITFTRNNESFRIISDNGEFKVQKLKIIKPSTKKFTPLRLFTSLWLMMFSYSGEEVEVLEEKNLL